MGAVSQLFARLSQEIEEQKPKNCIHFIVDFLCKHYPEHLHGFASIWQMDPDLERERHEVVNFFKAHKISTAVAAHFTNAGFDTLDTLTTLSPDSLVDVEAFNNVKWLPGHKVRLQQIFSEISARVRAYRQQYGELNARRPANQPAHHGHHSHHGASGYHHQSSLAAVRNASPSRAASPVRQAYGGYAPSAAPHRLAIASTPHYAPAPHILSGGHQLGGAHQLGGHQLGHQLGSPGMSLAANQVPSLLSSQPPSLLGPQLASQSQNIFYPNQGQGLYPHA